MTRTGTVPGQRMSTDTMSRRGRWAEEAKLLASDGRSGDFFGGDSVSSSGSNHCWLVRDGQMVTVEDSGAAYVFQYDEVHASSGSKWRSSLRRSELRTLLFGDARVDFRTATPSAERLTTFVWPNSGGWAYFYDLGDLLSCLQLQADNLVAGQTSSFEVSGGEPGRPVLIAWGVREGTFQYNFNDLWCVDFGFAAFPISNPFERVVALGQFDQNGVFQSRC
jgi:hypothetical protein